MNNCFAHDGLSRLVTMTGQKNGPFDVVFCVSGLAFYSLGVWCNSHMICHVIQTSLFNLKPLKAFQKYKPGGLFSEFYESLTEALFGLSFVAGVKRRGGSKGARRDYSSPGAYHPVFTPPPSQATAGSPTPHLLLARSPEEATSWAGLQDSLTETISTGMGENGFKISISIFVLLLLLSLSLSLSLSSLLSRSSSFSSCSWIELSYWNAVKLWSFTKIFFKLSKIWEPKIYIKQEPMIKAVYVRGVLLGLNDCQGWHTFRYINLGPHLNSAEYESICEDISLFKKKALKLQFPRHR